MDMSVRRILENYLESDAELKNAAQNALELLDGHDFPLKEKPLRPQSSLNVADVQKVRRKINYYNRGKVEVLGLDETIASLAKEDVPVYLQALELSRGVIALWLSFNYPRLLGVMCFKYCSK